MKKLIAMLLCIAMIAALGVQAFALTETDAEKKQALIEELDEFDNEYSESEVLHTEHHNLIQKIDELEQRINELQNNGH